MQERALEIVFLLDHRQKAQQNEWAFKMALISHDPSKWLPYFFPPTVEVETEEGLDDLLGGEMPVAMEFDKVDPSEAVRMLDELLRNTSGSFDATDMGVKQVNEEWQ